MEYEINVLKNNTPYFKVTASRRNIKSVYEQLKEAFTDCELSVTKWETVGRKVNMETEKF